VAVVVLQVTVLTHQELLLAQVDLVAVAVVVL
jgi:hypothetical protein